MTDSTERCEELTYREQGEALCTWCGLANRRHAPTCPTVNGWEPLPGTPGEPQEPTP